MPRPATLLTLVVLLAPGSALAASGYASVEDAKRATKKLVGILGQTYDGSVVRLHCVRAIGSIGTEAHEAIPALLKCTEDMAWETRQAVAMALGRVAGPHYDAQLVGDGVVTNKVPKLARGPNDTVMKKLSYNMIEDRASGVRIEACRALVYLGPPQPSEPAKYEELATPFLTKVMGRLAVERELSVKIWLQLIALMYDDRQMPSVLAQMRTLAGDRDAAVQVQALNALAVIGPKARAASPVISSALGSDNYYVVNAAINAMGGLGYEEIVSQVPNLNAALAKTTNPRIKERVKFVLDEVPKLKKPPGVLPPPPVGP